MGGSVGTPFTPPLNYPTYVLPNLASGRGVYRYVANLHLQPQGQLLVSMKNFSFSNTYLKILSRGDSLFFKTLQLHFGTISLFPQNIH
jgi:hypothetical protein